MVLKTFNVDQSVYAAFSAFCKDHGISMSRQIDMFMRSFMAREPKVRQEYLRKLERLRKGKFIRVTDIDSRY